MQMIRDGLTPGFPEPSGLKVSAMLGKQRGTGAAFPALEPTASREDCPTTLSTTGELGTQGSS